MNKFNIAQIPIKYVLLVEDNPDEILLTERAFAICHISENLIVMNDGQKALDFLDNRKIHKEASPRKKPSIILLDLNLPRISGLDVLQRIRNNADTGAIPVIILTSSTDDRDISESFRLGIDEYIIKPTSFSEFIQIIRRIKSKWIDS